MQVYDNSINIGGYMGLLWEMHQQSSAQRASQIQAASTASLEERVAMLEQLFQELDNEFEIVVRNLEQKLGDDINNDGKIPA